MAVKKTGQFGFADLAVSRVHSAGGPLERFERLVKWYRFEKVLKGLTDDGAGRPAYPSVVMFKALLLQSLYGLSDAELEEALSDRISFRRFIGLSMEERVPDHTTLCRFRNRLVTERLHGKLFAELDRQLEAAGLMMKRGTMLDATLIETAASARPPMDRSTPAHDSEAAFARRSGKSGSVYGYKAHVGVDVGSGLIRSVIATPANVNDTVVADGLIIGDEKAVYADSAYHTHRRAAALKARGIKPRLMRRANRHHPELPPRLKHYNRLISRVRAAVETTFATTKRRMKFTAIRYVGLAKAAAQVTMAAIAFNLRRWSRTAAA
jgi:transposase, IS5 family